MPLISLFTLTGWGLLAFCTAWAWTSEPVNLDGSIQPTQEEVREALLESAEREDRLPEFEEGLQHIYSILPKNAHGLLEPQAVRYALHRFFLKRYGWTIRGLEQGVASSSTNTSTTREGWVPAQLQRLVQASNGVDLSTLATLAASLEDLVCREVEKYLRLAYKMEVESTDSLISRKRAEEILETYYLIFLLSKQWNVNNRMDLQIRKVHIALTYKAHQEALAFLHEVLDGRLQDSMDFKGMASVAHEIGRQYRHLNDVECKDLKAALTDNESRKPGRVRLSVFYNMSRGHFSFWERPDFLRAMGALDDSEATMPSVIIPNYALGRINCFKEASELYLICCHDECQDHLMSHLEKEIGAPTAPPERIASLVSNLPSELVEAPRQLPSKLLERLTEVASANGGQVPLHGRLFAQWMHHAYPLECPLPLEAGLKLQTPEEWIEGTGLKMELSEEEMHQHVTADVCTMTVAGSKPACAGESIELLWTETEELFGMDSPVAVARGRRSEPLVISSCLLVLLAVWVATHVPPHVFVPGRKHGFVLVVLLTAWFAYCVDLLDGTVFGVGAASSLAVLATGYFRRGRVPSTSDCEGEASKWHDYSLGKCV